LTHSLYLEVDQRVSDYFLTIYSIFQFDQQALDPYIPSLLQLLPHHLILVMNIFPRLDTDRSAQILSAGLIQRILTVFNDNQELMIFALVNFSRLYAKGSSKDLTPLLKYLANFFEHPDENLEQDDLRAGTHIVFNIFTDQRDPTPDAVRALVDSSFIASVLSSVVSTAPDERTTEMYLHMVHHLLMQQPIADAHPIDLHLLSLFTELLEIEEICQSPECYFLLESIESVVMGCHDLNLLEQSGLVDVLMEFEEDKDEGIQAMLAHFKSLS
jgi:hypothetical protein